jgi:predicted permease
VGLTTQGLGFRPAGLLLASVDLRRAGVAAEQRGPLVEQMRTAVAALPGVEATAASFVTPLSGSTWFLEADVPGFTGGPDERNTMFNAVTPDYFTAFGTPLLAGRDVTAADAPGRPRVMVVNEAFARKFFNGENPVGRSFTLEGYGRNPRNHLVEVVGLVADAKYQSLREPRYPTMYGAFHQQDAIGPSSRLAIRTTGDPWAMREAVMRAMAAVNADVAVDLRAFAEDVTAGLLQERLVAVLSAAFGALALLLAALGLYGVMSYAVARRRNEIGIRIALGAEPGTVIRLVLSHVASITAIGIAAGALAAAGGGRFINSLLFNVAATDLALMAVTAVTLALAAAVAGYLPARRAARIDPMLALRDE